jgi:hypothetical protein
MPPSLNLKKTIFKGKHLVKGIVKRILRGVDGRLKQSILLNWSPGRFLILNFKGTLSQEEHKTIFNDLRELYQLCLV